MNPQDHTGRHASPWIEGAESADMGDQVFHTLHVPAGGHVAGPIPISGLVRHRKRRTVARDWALAAWLLLATVAAAGVAFGVGVIAGGASL